MSSDSSDVSAGSYNEICTIDVIKLEINLHVPLWQNFDSSKPRYLMPR